MFNTERIISWLCIPPVNSAVQYSSSYDLWIVSGKVFPRHFTALLASVWAIQFYSAPLCIKH